MNNLQFNALSTPRKTETLMLQGQFLYSRNEPAFLIDVYRLDGFYVDIYFQKSGNVAPVLRSYYQGDVVCSSVPEDKVYHLYQAVVRPTA